MFTWFFFALAAAVANSIVQVVLKWAVAVSRYSKFTIGFIMTGVASVILITVSYALYGLPTLSPEFWKAALISGVLNAIALPIMLKAYELGEFSSVYSMIFLTPVFLLVTSFITLGEQPSMFGIIGVILTVIGLIVVARGKEGVRTSNTRLGNWLAVLVAFIYSITVNYDKLAALHSNRFLGFGIINAVMAIAAGLYLLIRYKKVVVKSVGPASDGAPNHFAFPPLLILFALGCFAALSGVAHSSALLTGFASYTIAIKRIGVLFGVFWGWLFFHEKNIARKFFGAGIAIVGTIAILFS